MPQPAENKRKVRVISQDARGDVTSARSRLYSVFKISDPAKMAALVAEALPYLDRVDKGLEEIETIATLAQVRDKPNKKRGAQEDEA